MFYFIFSPNNSGTTVMAQYAAQQSGAFLPPVPSAEGQLLPAVREMMRNRPWDTESPFDWAYIRAQWEDAMHKAGKSDFVEGSPPNMIRVARILDTFPERRAVLSIANPFSQIASCIKNYNTVINVDVLRNTTLTWVEKATIQRRNMERWPDIPRITYEAFCHEPAVLNRALGFPVTDVEPVAGKGNSRIPFIVDMTVKNICFLTVFEVLAITETLSAHQDLLDAFGYRLIDRAAYDDMMRAEPGLAAAGLVDRSAWHVSPRAARVAPV